MELRTELDNLNNISGPRAADEIETPLTRIADILRTRITRLSEADAQLGAGLIDFSEQQSTYVDAAKDAEVELRKVLADIQKQLSETGIITGIQSGAEVNLELSNSEIQAVLGELENQIELLSTEAARITDLSPLGALLKVEPTSVDFTYEELFGPAEAEIIRLMQEFYDKILKEAKDRAVDPFVIEGAGTGLPSGATGSTEILEIAPYANEYANEVAQATITVTEANSDFYDTLISIEDSYAEELSNRFGITLDLFEGYRNALGDIDIERFVREKGGRPLEDSVQDLRDITTYTLPIRQDFELWADAGLTVAESLLIAGGRTQNLLNTVGMVTSDFNDWPSFISATGLAIADVFELLEFSADKVNKAIIGSDNSLHVLFERLNKLTSEQRAEFLQSVPEGYRDNLERMFNEYARVHGRIAGHFSDSLFKLLPKEIQTLLATVYQDITDRSRTLFTAYDKVNEIITDGETLVSDKIRLTSAAVAEEFGNFTQNYEGLLSAFEAIGSGASGNQLDLITGVLQGISGSLGQEADRLPRIVYRVADNLGLIDQAMTNLDYSVDAVERSFQGLTSTISPATLQLAGSMATLYGATQGATSAIEGAAYASLQLAEASKEVEISNGLLVEGQEDLQKALRLTSFSYEDVAAAAAALAAQNITGIITVGAGVVTEAVNNVVTSAVDYINISKVAATIPPFIANADVAVIAAAANELRKYNTEAAKHSEILSIEQSFGITTPIGPELSQAAQELESSMGAIAAITPVLESDLFRARLAMQGIDTEGKNVFETMLNAGYSIKQVFDEIKDFFSADIFGPAVDQARLAIQTFNTLSNTIAHNARVAITEMQYQLEETQRAATDAENTLLSKLETDLEVYRDKLDADMISLEKYYEETDALKAATYEQIASEKEATVKLQNQIQQAKWEAEVQALNMRKITATANIIISTAMAIAQAFALNPILGAVLTPGLLTMSATQIAAVQAQQPPPKPPKIELQHGGVVTQPTYATIGEGTAHEAVIPLDKYKYVERDKEERMSDGVTIVVNVSGNVITENDLARFVSNAIRGEISKGRIRAFR